MPLSRDHRQLLGHARIDGAQEGDAQQAQLGGQRLEQHPGQGQGGIFAHPVGGHVGQAVRARLGQQRARAAGQLRLARGQRGGPEALQHAQAERAVQAQLPVEDGAGAVHEAAGVQVEHVGRAHQGA
jgi:hypothetical protein